MKKVAFVFSHCHWDIEWYMPYRSFRFWLLDVFDRLFEVTRDRRFKTYVLDGQVAPVEHYLSVRPEKTAEIKRLVGSGKLSIGPFYTQFDEWLISGESIVRNCLQGNRRAGKFGQIMKAGYLPDNFGHPRQMPQILAGFGIDSFIFMRGMPDKPAGTRDEFFWQGLDGTKILAIHLSRGYFNAACLGARNDRAASVFRTGPYGESLIGFERLSESVTDCDVGRGAETLVHRAREAASDYPSGIIPLANGCDHSPPQAQVSDIIERANGIQDEFLFVHGNCEDLVRRIKRRGRKLPTFSRDLYGARYWNLHVGTLSTRSYVKQANFAAETLLEKYAEPLAGLAALYGKDYPSTMLDEAWRFMFLNHAHDSIHGSSVDPVHREMLQRFDNVRQTTTGLCHNSLKYLGGFLPGRRKKHEGEILVYNPVGSGAAPAVVDLWVNTGGEHFHIEDRQGRALPAQTLDVAPPSGHKGKSSYDPWPIGGPRHILFAAPGLPRGIHSFAIIRGKAASPPCRNTETTITNEFLRVEFRKGSLDVYDKVTKRWYKGLNVIEDEADAGDVWDFSEAWETNLIYSSRHFPAKCRLIENGPVRSTLLVQTCMRIPCCLAGEKRSRRMVSIPVDTRISLVQGARRVEVSVLLDNRAGDHRLRLKCRTGIAGETVKSQGHFGIVERPLRNPYSGKNWVLPPPQTFHFREWVAVDNGRHGLAVACRGLYEYEARRAGRSVVLYFTLLRSVGRMTKTNLRSRAKAACEISVPVPEAQCMGRQRFEYAFVPYSCEKKNRAPFSASVNAFLFPPIAHLIRGERAGKTKDIETLPFELEPANLVVSCFKKAEDDNGYVLRFWENEGRKTLARIMLSKRFGRASRVNLNEETLTELKILRNRLEIEVGPYKIITLKLVTSQ